MDGILIPYAKGTEVQSKNEELLEVCMSLHNTRYRTRLIGWTTDTVCHKMRAEYACSVAAGLACAFW